MSEEVKFSIIIRCFNEELHIARLLTGISRQTETDYEIILVDSGSTDATLSIASQYPVKIVYISPEEFSFGRALNRGCREASGEFLVFISAHCYPVYNDWLKCLTEPFKDPRVALSYGRQIGDLTTQFSEHRVFSAWFPPQSDFCKKDPFCNNANAAIRKSLRNEISYNEDITGLEDLSWAKQALEKGYLIAYSAKAEIVHVHNETPGQVKNRYRREAMALKSIFPSQSFSLWDFFHLFFRNMLSDSSAAIKEHVFLKNFKPIVTFRFMQFWGTYKGFSSKEGLTTQLRRTFYYPKTFSGSEISSDTQTREHIDYSNLRK